MITRRRPPFGWSLTRFRFRLAALFCVAAIFIPPRQVGSSPIEQPPVDIQSVGPGALPSLPYWPFGPHSGHGTPTLARVDIEARVELGGCGVFEWSVHPVPGSNASGPFCVGVLSGTAMPLLVVGRPGGAPYVLVPTELAVSVGADGVRVVRLGQPGMTLPAVAEAIRRWAAAPEGRR